MRILDLYIDGFGKFHNREISFENGLNIIYGKNEAGKSTLHTFIRGMLFGIERTRGRASKNDLYNKYEPWENKGTYEGRLRFEHKDHIYRFERSFQKNTKKFTIVDETIGREVEPSRSFLDDVLCGLSETAYNNTISIGQLKCATDDGMVSELKNYIANLNTTGNMALNITKATEFLKSQRKGLEALMVPEAARSYTSLLSEIRNIEKEISSPEYENQIQAYQHMRSEVKNIIEQKQLEKEDLLQKAARGKQVLASGQFTDQASITSYLNQGQEVYNDYLHASATCGKRSTKILSTMFFIIALLSACGAAYLYFSGDSNYITKTFDMNPFILVGSAAIVSFISFLVGISIFLKRKRSQKDLAMTSKVLSEMFSRHLGDSSISPEAMNAFQERMAEMTRLSTAVSKSEALIDQNIQEIDSLLQKQNTCNDVIEKQQRIQWELEKKLEHLANCKTQAEALKHILAENDRIREELAAIDLAQETMTSLSSTIRDSFGLYLNKTASNLINQITGGIYSSLSVDENLSVYLNTKTRLVPMEQVSSGTIDQIYLALRLATAKLIQGNRNQNRMPLIFDDSFVLYDDERLKTALKWLSKAFDGQIIIFTCHRREAQMLTANQIPYHLIEI